MSRASRSPDVSRQGDWRTRLGDRMPARLAIPLRERWGPAREPEMALLPKFVGPGHLCIDVGANKGTWTQAMRRIVGPSGTVVAVEPQSLLADYLREGFNHSSVVEVHQCAVSADRGSLRLLIPRDESGLVRGHATLEPSTAAGVWEEVRVCTLDDLLGERVTAFIKVDVEGHEWGVLEGARRLFERSRPALVIEMMDNSREGTGARCFRRLVSDYGYEAAILVGSDLRPVDSWPPGDRPTPNVVFAQELPATIL